MLSSQTKDEVTNAAIINLRSALGGSISVEGMIDAEDSVIAEAISKVGFWRRKTGFVDSIYTFETIWNLKFSVLQLSQTGCSQATRQFRFRRAKDR